MGHVQVRGSARTPNPDSSNLDFPSLGVGYSWQNAFETTA